MKNMLLLLLALFIGPVESQAVTTDTYYNDGAASTITIGRTMVAAKFTVADNGNVAYLYLSQSASENAGASFLIGIYRDVDGAPGTLMGTTAVIVSVTDGPNELSGTPAVALHLNQGDVVWAVLQGSYGDTRVFYDATGGTGYYKGGLPWTGELEDPFPTGSTTVKDYAVGFSVTEDAATPTITPTNTPTPWINTITWVYDPATFPTIGITYKANNLSVTTGEIRWGATAQTTPTDYPGYVTAAAADDILSGYWSISPTVWSGATLYTWMDAWGELGNTISAQATYVIPSFTPTPTATPTAWINTITSLYTPEAYPTYGVSYKANNLSVTTGEIRWGPTAQTTPENYPFYITATAEADILTGYCSLDGQVSSGQTVFMWMNAWGPDSITISAEATEIVPTFSTTISQSPTFTPTISQSPTFTPTISQSPTFTPTISQSPTFTKTVTKTTTPTITPCVTKLVSLDGRLGWMDTCSESFLTKALPVTWNGNTHTWDTVEFSAIKTNTDSLVTALLQAAASLSTTVQTSEKPWTVVACAEYILLSWTATMVNVTSVAGSAGRAYLSTQGPEGFYWCMAPDSSAPSVRGHYQSATQTAFLAGPWVAGTHIALTAGETVTNTATVVLQFEKQ